MLVNLFIISMFVEINLVIMTIKMINEHEKKVK